MNDLVHRVPGLSWSQVEQYAERTLSLVAPEHRCLTAAIPILEVLEFRLGRIDPQVVFCVKELPLGYEGSVDWDVVDSRFEVALSPKVYEGLLEGRPRDRMTAAHELGHFVLHRDVIRSFRETEFLYGSSGLMMRRSVAVAPWEDPERQAEVFAGRILIPRSSALPALQNSDLNNRQWLRDVYQVSDSAASVRMRELRGG